MSRLPRILPRGVPAHLVHRGNDRQPIFGCDADRLFLRECLRQASGESQVAIHGYVLMPNHIHLLATSDRDGGISRMMQCAARRYVGYFNARYRRTGTLWEGRFHATAIESDRYFLACHRYIDMNPVRAGIALVPEGYRWSSHRHYALGEADSLVRPHPIALALAHPDALRPPAYRRLFDSPPDDGELRAIREASQACRPLRQWLERRATGSAGRGRPRKIVSDTSFGHAAGQGTARSWDAG